MIELKRNLHSLLLHLYYSSPDNYWADRLLDWDFNKVPSLEILQKIYDDWTSGKVELNGVELNEFQEMWICDLSEIVGKRLNPIEGDV